MTPHQESQPNKNAGTENDTESARLEDRGIPRYLVFWSIGIGLALTVAGAVVITLLGQAAHVGTLMTCVGFGLVLGAFGTRSVGKWRNFNMAGSGAMAVALFLLLQAYTPKPPPPPPIVPFVYGYLQNTEKMREIVLAAQNNLLVGRRDPQSMWQFFARGEWLTGETFSLLATPPEGKGPSTIIIGCLPLSLLRERLGSPEGVDLTLIEKDPANEEWELVRTDVSGKAQPIGSFGNPTCSSQGPPRIKAGALLRKAADALIASAEAATSLSAVEVHSLFSNLNSGSLATQVQAQTAIARQRDGSSIDAIVRTWEPARSNDRLDTSLLVAWVSAIRQDRANATIIASAFSQGQPMRPARET